VRRPSANSDQYGKLTASRPEIDAISSNYRPLLLSLFPQKT